MRFMPEFDVSCHIAIRIWLICIWLDMREAHLLLEKKAGFPMDFTNDWRTAGLCRFADYHSARALSTTSVASASTLSRASGDSKDSAYTL